MDLKGKVAFVTGGSGDIGGSVARSLATAGADVAISYVGQLKPPPRLLMRCEQRGDEAWPCSLINVTRLPSTRQSTE